MKRASVSTKSICGIEIDPLGVRTTFLAAKSERERDSNYAHVSINGKYWLLPKVHRSLGEEGVFYLKAVGFLIGLPAAKIKLSTGEVASIASVLAERER